MKKPIGTTGSQGGDDAGAALGTFSGTEKTVNRKRKGMTERGRQERWKKSFPGTHWDKPTGLFNNT